MHPVHLEITDFQFSVLSSTRLINASPSFEYEIRFTNITLKSRIRKRSTALINVFFSKKAGYSRNWNLATRVWQRMRYAFSTDLCITTKNCNFFECFVAFESGTETVPDTSKARGDLNYTSAGPKREVVWLRNG